MSSSDLITFIQLLHYFYFSNICTITSTTTSTFDHDHRTRRHHLSPTPELILTPSTATKNTYCHRHHHLQHHYSAHPRPSRHHHHHPGLSVVTEDNSQGTIGIGNGVRCCVKLGAMETLNACRNSALYLNLQSHMHFLGKRPVLLSEFE